jgi:RNA polymerase sigma-70 factor (ECF subfamily)
MTRERDERARRFDALARAHGADLYRFALWLCGHEALARDLVQETFLRAWKALDALRDDGAARSWLITILRREYARTFERKVPKLVDIDAVPVPETGAPGPDRHTERDLLREAIAQLPPRYREPLLLQVVIGLSGAEIAQALDISQSAVMTRLFRAREKLMARVQRDGITGTIDGPF